jgi:hypothetical protein
MWIKTPCIAIRSSMHSQEVNCNVSLLD